MSTNQRPEWPCEGSDVVIEKTDSPHFKKGGTVDRIEEREPGRYRARIELDEEPGHMVWAWIDELG